MFARHPRQKSTSGPAGSTALGAALDYAANMLEVAPACRAQTVDISGDGINNSGREVGLARQEALDQGIVLNGLAVLDRTPPPAGLASLQPLDEYYRERVIGGPGAFLVVAEAFDSFGLAVRIADTGQGIAAEDLERLFSPFDRLGAERGHPRRIARPEQIARE